MESLFSLGFKVEDEALALSGELPQSNYIMTI